MSQDRAIPFRNVLAATIVCWVLGPASRSLAQPDSGDPSQEPGVETLEYSAVGELGQEDSQYTLLDADGSLQAYLVPQESLELDRYLGRRVAVTGRTPVQHEGEVASLWVEHVEPVAQRERSADLAQLQQAEQPQPLVLAQFAEPIPDPGLSPMRFDPYGVPFDRWSGPDWIWVDAEYLLWWTDGMDLPPLVTTSPAGTPREEAGVLGQSATQILFGDDDILTGERHGLRFRSGVWFDTRNRIGLQGEYFGLGNESASFFRGSNASGSPILARPFFNVNPRDPFGLGPDPPVREDSQLVAFPSVLSGSVTVDASTRLHSAGIGLRANLASDLLANTLWAEYSRVDLLAGYRYLNLQDRLRISDRATSLDPLSPASFRVFDSFDTRNEFHGADLGLTWESGWECWSFEFLLRAALGNVHQVVNIQGGTTITEGTAPAMSSPGGLLALPSNIARHDRDRLAVIPEIGFNLAYRILPQWHVTAGFTLLYWGAAVRSGDQINRDVNPDQLPPPIDPLVGPLRPGYRFREGAFWAQGLSLGLQGQW